MATRTLDLIVFTLLLTGTAASAQAGDLYQWKDSKGVTHYSDAPPPKGHYASRRVQDQPDTPPAASTQASGSAKPGTVAERVRSNCDTAKANLQLLAKGGDVGLDADHDGKPDAPLDARDAARQAQIAQANIAKFCSQTAATP